MAYIYSHLPLERRQLPAVEFILRVYGPISLPACCRCSLSLLRVAGSRASCNLSVFAAAPRVLPAPQCGEAAAKDAVHAGRDGAWGCSARQRRKVQCRQHGAQRGVLHAHFDGHRARRLFRHVEDLWDDVAKGKATCVQHKYAAQQLQPRGADDICLLSHHRAADEGDREDGNDGREGPASSDRAREEAVERRSDHDWCQHHLAGGLEERRDIHGHQRANSQLREEGRGERREECGDGGHAHAERHVSLGKEGHDVASCAAGAACHQHQPDCECLWETTKVRDDCAQSGHDGVLEQHPAGDVERGLHEAGEVLRLKRSPHANHCQCQPPNDPVAGEPEQ
mmetsp:Transcript_46651/g.118083  ORF Transcript_46651/g.118083 Transcript_46651/m.118083 type:complete len:339 (+) Transcript_46651:25-1041(+)